MRRGEYLLVDCCVALRLQSVESLNRQSKDMKLVAPKSRGVKARSE